MSTLATLAPEPTKQQEIDHLAEFVATLPRWSYLSDYLAGSVAEFSGLIRQDITFPRAETIRRLVAEHAEALDAVNAARKQLAELQTRIAHETARDERRKSSLREELREILTQADAIARDARKTLSESRSA